MNTTTHLPQKIHQNAKNTSNKTCLNNQTKIKRWRSHKNQSTEKRKNKKEVRTEGSTFCFVAVTSDEGAKPSTILHNWGYMAERTRSEAEGV